jgi:hypothetical protein
MTPLETVLLMVVSGAGGLLLGQIIRIRVMLDEHYKQLRMKRRARR